MSKGFQRVGFLAHVQHFKRICSNDCWETNPPSHFDAIQLFWGGHPQWSLGVPQILDKSLLVLWTPNFAGTLGVLSFFALRWDIFCRWKTSGWSSQIQRPNTSLYIMDNQWKWDKSGQTTKIPQVGLRAFGDWWIQNYIPPGWGRVGCSLPPKHCPSSVLLDSFLVGRYPSTSMWHGLTVSMKIRKKYGKNHKFFFSASDVVLFSHGLFSVHLLYKKNVFWCPLLPSQLTKPGLASLTISVKKAGAWTGVGAPISMV